MANHAKQIQPPPAPEAPEVQWGTIVKTDQGWHLATMVTKGGRVLRQDLGQAETYRPVIEERFRVWAALNVLARE